MKMKSILTALALLGSLTAAFAQNLNIPAADGSDLALTPLAPPSGPANVVIDLSQALPGDALTYSNTGVNQQKGIYDAARWVIVFKYSSVNIPAGVTVTFINHPSYAPVVWLVQGSVNIAGTVSVNGKNGVIGTGALVPTEPGPGGFRGGAYGPSGYGAGLGPGGGSSVNALGGYNASYGNPQILPLVGGSGSSSTSAWPASGGGAGGALLIAAPSTIQITGSVTAVGGFAVQNGYANGAGGAIKLITNQVTGTGSLNADTTGRVRIEAYTLAVGITSTPSTIAVVPAVLPSTTPTLFQSLSSPTVKVTKVDTVALRDNTNPPPNVDDPRANLVTTPDLSIFNNSPVNIELHTYNFATGGATVSVRIAPKYGSATNVNATYISGTATDALWRVTNVTIPPGFVTIQARATQP